MTKIANLLIACTLASALQSIAPGAHWNLSGTDYSGLVWLDATTPPSKDQIDQWISNCQSLPPSLSIDQRISNLEENIQAISQKDGIALPVTIAQ